MERVAFLIEQTGEHVTCLLNPEELLLRREAGLRRRSTFGGHLTGQGLSDDPLLYTGGGSTEITMNLLFDVTLAGSTIETDDVRQLTSPLWNLAENRQDTGGHLAPPTVRFLWGKQWNIPCVVAAVAERLDAFDMYGTPQRSWFRMKMLRVQDDTTSDSSLSGTDKSSTAGLISELADSADEQAALQQWQESLSAGDMAYHEVTGGERLDELASEYYGDPSQWRLIALFNDIENPNELEAGQILMLPPTPDIVWQVISHSASEFTDSLLYSFSSLRRFDPFVSLRMRL